MALLAGELVDRHPGATGSRGRTPLPTSGILAQARGDVETLRLTRREILALPAAFLPVSLAGCGPRLKDRLVGRWKQVGGPLVLDFAADGTVTVSPGLVTLRGRFATPDDQHIRFEGDGLLGSVLGTQQYEARTERDRLYLKIGAVQTEYARE